MDSFSNKDAWIYDRVPASDSPNSVYLVWTEYSLHGTQYHTATFKYGKFCYYRNDDLGGKPIPSPITCFMLLPIPPHLYSSRTTKDLNNYEKVQTKSR